VDTQPVRALQANRVASATAPRGRKRCHRQPCPVTMPPWA